MAKRKRILSDPTLLKIQKNYDLKIKYYAIKHSLDPDLVMAIIATESAGDPQATGGAGDIGLMQITLVALVEYNRYFSLDEIYSQLYDPETNIRVGCGYLKICFEYYEKEGKKGTEQRDLAIRSYNAGFYGVSLGRSKDYLKKVLSWLEKIK